jgi:predicted transcriptional regulator
MDKRKNRNVIVISIKPQFAHGILNGVKKVEFRRNGCPTEISHLVLYSIVPDQSILGFCEVKNCVIASPDELWKRYGKDGLIKENEFLKYYQGHSTGKCYLLNNPQTFVRPVPLDKCRSFKKSPQSFVYMDEREWINLKRKKVKFQS